MIERILKLLEESDIKAAKLASDLGLSNSAVTDWKKGKSRPSTDAIIKIAEYFGVTTDYLLTGKNSPLFLSFTELEKTDLEKILLKNFRGLNENQMHDIINKTAQMLSKDIT